MCGAYTVLAALTILSLLLPSIGSWWLQSAEVPLSVRPRSPTCGTDDWVRSHNTTAFFKLQNGFAADFSGRFAPNLHRGLPLAALRSFSAFPPLQIATLK